MRIVFTIGTAGTSGGTGVLLDMIQFTEEMGYDTVIFCLDKHTAAQWNHRYPLARQLLSEHEIKPDDVLIVSEEFVWAAAHLSHITNKYIILNQGLNASLVSDFKRNTYLVTKLIYQGAIGVIANSQHTKDNIEKLFDIKSVHPFIIRIDDKFEPKEKSNMVSYMSRKNRAFGCFVVNYLCGKYPDVDFVDICNVDSDQVADIMSRSRVFLSFGGPEGFGLPPLEAAISGCKVVGFDGGGGEEYFNRPIFTKIPFYDHMEFIEQAEMFVRADHIPSMYEEQRLKLKNHYSLDNSRKSFYNAMNSMLGDLNG